MTLDAVASAVAGRVAEPATGRVVVDAPVVVDSRQATAGALFAAVVGEQVDGHSFAGDAAERGAVAALASRPVTGLPAVLVDDVVAALGALAQHVLATLRTVAAPSVVGITGSSGKTSTKDVLAQVLAASGPTIAPAGSFNNEIGLPLTVLRADASTRHLVLEMSARGIGHIAALCAIAPVDVAVVLNVGTAHLGEFGSREAIAAAKGELLDGVVGGGSTILNVDDPLVAAMTTRARGRVVTVGQAAAADVRAADVTLDPAGRASYTLVTSAGSSLVQLQLVGGHHVANSLAAAAAALELGMTQEAVTDALCAAVPLSRWRMEMRQTPDGVRLVNDAYNANPESMRAALAALVHIGAGQTTWAVLGPMAELGDDGPAEHLALGRHCVEIGVSHVVAVGEAARAIADGVRSGGGDVVECADAQAAVELLRARLVQGDTVLVKASRAAGLEQVADALAPDRSGEAA
ncbi:MAG TPA: UDP-N-acetylmuramoyl-tripeptide--D-alanyl-D-alanine ligase [Mycobacteriales bacterium]|nr:UDP-N-acetylmuramoyl-tripeptide--D-alanyl-D-alanine ligase [Mycobacteriales bacterium]